MKEKYKMHGIPFLVTIGGLCAALDVLLWRSGTSAGQALPGLMAFPFAWIGQGLRALSLTGWAGNLLAWVLYLLAALCPIIGVVVLRRQDRSCRADLLLILTSALLLPVLYWMINPGLLGRWFPSMLPTEQVQAVCGAVIWSCLLSWVVLRVLHALPLRSIQQLLGQLDGLLTALNILIVVQVCGIELYSLLSDLSALKQANTALSPQQLHPTQLFMILHYAVEALPSVLTIGVLRQGQRLLRAAIPNRYSEETVHAARHLTEICRRAIILSILGLLAFALAQLAFASQLYNLQANVTLPLSDIAFLMGTLVFAHWMAEGKALKDENEGFV